MENFSPSLIYGTSIQRSRDLNPIKSELLLHMGTNTLEIDLTPRRKDQIQICLKSDLQIRGYMSEEKAPTRSRKRTDILKTRIYSFIHVYLTSFSKPWIQVSQYKSDQFHHKYIFRHI